MVTRGGLAVSLLLALIFAAEPAKAQRRNPYSRAPEVGVVSTRGQRPERPERPAPPLSLHANVQLGYVLGANTPEERMLAIGRQVTEKIPNLRACYDTVIATHPEVTGTIRMSIAVLGGVGTPTVDPLSFERFDSPFVQCLSSVLSSIHVTAANRPANFTLSLTFNNDSAEQAQRERQERLQAPPVTITGTGADAVARVSIPVAGIALEATGPADANDLRAVGDAILDELAPLLECRRRAQAHHAAEGEVIATYRVVRSRLGRPRMVSSTLNNTIATTCVMRALRVERFNGSPALTDARVKVQFFETVLGQ